MYNVEIMSEQQESAQYKREPITSQTVLDSIQDLEPWSEQLKSLMVKDKEGITSFLDSAVATYREFEQKAQRPESHLISPEEAEKIKAIWVISAPGTYFEGRKNDRYQDKEWALWADRQRINYAFGMARKIAEANADRKFEGNLPTELKALAQYTPLVIYNGRPDENAALTEAVEVPWLKIPEGLGYPKERVFIINPLTTNFNSRYNLLDQIRSFHLPRGFEVKPQDTIGVVAHAPQAVRFLYSLNANPGAFPEGVKIKVLPLPTPKSGIPEYPTQELRGLVNYRFIANPALVSATPYSYTV